MVRLQPHQIHIIEDSQADYLALSRALTQAANELETTLAFFHHRSSEQAFEALLAGDKPDLIFIDINLGGDSGLAFLRRVRSEVRITPCPKIILTTSTCEADVKDSFNEGAAGYLVKPLNYSELRESVKVCLQYWFMTSRRPPVQSGGDQLTGGPPPPRC